jgi:hypothetical protein
MAHSPELRMQLRAAYIGGLPLEHAAEKVGVPPGTARNWYRAARDTGDDWDKFRAASLIVAGGGIEQALGRIIAAGLMRCEALLEKTADAEDPFEGRQGHGHARRHHRQAARRRQKLHARHQRGGGGRSTRSRRWPPGPATVAPARGIVLADLLEGFASARKLPIAAPFEELRARARAAGAVDTPRPAASPTTPPSRSAARFSALHEPAA